MCCQTSEQSEQDTDVDKFAMSLSQAKCYVKAGKADEQPQSLLWSVCMVLNQIAVQLQLAGLQLCSMLCISVCFLHGCA